MAFQWQRPTSDLVRSRWTGSGGSSATVIWDTIDEYHATHDSDTTYAYASKVGATFRCKFEAPPNGDPTTDGGQFKVQVKAKRVNQFGGTNPKFTNRLYQGNGTTLIKSQQFTLGAATNNTYVSRIMTMNSTEFGNVTDWSDLHVDITLDVAPTVEVRITAIDIKTVIPVAGRTWFGPFAWRG